jgi:hypothetical protein
MRMLNGIVIHTQTPFKNTNAHTHTHTDRLKDTQNLSDTTFLVDYKIRLIYEASNSLQ